MENFLFILTTIISAFITWLIVPKIRDIGLRFKLIDIPDERKQHNKPKVRLGGIAIFLGFIISYLVLLGLGNDYLSYPLSDRRIQIMLFGATLFFILGLTDDLFSLSPIKRLILQFIIASFIVSKGIIFTSLDFSIFNKVFPILSINKLIGFPVTVFWIVAITNSLNWIDGLDGLAAGVSIITGFGFFIISLLNNNLYCCFLSCVLIGSCLGFLKYNKYPSIILMGDGGSYFLGFVISFLGIFVSFTPSNEYNSTLLISTILFISVFLGDMIFVISKRISSGNSPFSPDRNHLHHRLLKSGFKHKNAVKLIYLFNILFSLIAIIIYSYTPRNLLFIILLQIIITSGLIYSSFYKRNLLSNK